MAMARDMVSQTRSHSSTTIICSLSQVLDMEASSPIRVTHVYVYILDIYIYILTCFNLFPGKRPSQVNHFGPFLVWDSGGGSPPNSPRSAQLICSCPSPSPLGPRALAAARRWGWTWRPAGGRPRRPGGRPGSSAPRPAKRWTDASGSMRHAGVLIHEGSGPCGSCVRGFLC